MAKLNQMVAVRKGLRARTEAAVTKIYHDFQKPALFAGMVRTYQPKDEEGERFPSERTMVQKTVEGALGDTAALLTKLMDVVATIDVANQDASAIVYVDDVAVLPPLPVPFLLFLDKQLEDLRTQVSKAPTQDPADRWTPDPAVGGARTDESKTTRTRKVPKVLVKYDATDKHPAQTEVYTIDEVVGEWSLTKFSGAVAADRKLTLLDRINALSDGVKKAVEAANQMEVTQLHVGQQVFEYLLA